MVTPPPPINSPKQARPVRSKACYQYLSGLRRASGARPPSEEELYSLQRLAGCPGHHPSCSICCRLPTQVNHPSSTTLPQDLHIVGLVSAASPHPCSWALWSRLHSHRDLRALMATPKCPLISNNTPSTALSMLFAWNALEHLGQINWRVLRYPILKYSHLNYQHHSTAIHLSQ